MPKENKGVIPIRRGSLVSDADEEIVEVAYDFWVANGFRGASPEDALLIAVTLVKVARGETWPGLFLVPKRKPVRSAIRPPVAIPR